MKIFILLGFLSAFLFSTSISYAEDSLLQLKSIDTMKYSRDESRNPAIVNIIPIQVKAVADTGANYIAIDTPYDSKFLPILKTWILEARKNNLRVWLRGNWSGWEGWFDHPKNLTREEHLRLTKNFILNNPDLFEDGDIFTACPECEYGGPGNPLVTGDVSGYKQFMLDELSMMKDSFKQINKNVIVNYTSMNPDVAKRVLDEQMVNDLGNTIVLDEYAKDIKSLEEWFNYFKNKFPNAKIILGEFGAPIPDINGSMTNKQQADFIDSVMNFLLSRPDVTGLNYWVSVGGSTEIFYKDSTPKPAVQVIKKYFDPGIIKGKITDDRGKVLPNIPISAERHRLVKTNANGEYMLKLIEGKYIVKFGDTKDYSGSVKTIDVRTGKTIAVNVSLKEKNVSFIEKILRFLRIH